jgi:hypothetical protein
MAPRSQAVEIENLTACLLDAASDMQDIMVSKRFSIDITPEDRQALARIAERIETALGIARRANPYRPEGT